MVMTTRKATQDDPVYDVVCVGRFAHGSSSVQVQRRNTLFTRSRAKNMPRRHTSTSRTKSELGKYFTLYLCPCIAEISPTFVHRKITHKRAALIFPVRHTFQRLKTRQRFAMMLVHNIQNHESHMHRARDRSPSGLMYTEFIRKNEPQATAVYVP